MTGPAEPDTPGSANFPERGNAASIEQGAIFQPKFDADGLLPAIVTDADTGEALMFAYMNADALALTIETGTAHFWTRSRQRLWKKGEESGNTLTILELRTDCDQDVVWLKVRVNGGGVACHTGERTCFYRTVPIGSGRSGSPLGRAG